MSAVLEAREPIARYLEAIQPALTSHFDLLAKSPGGVARLRKLILDLAVQGKLLPQDPNDESASGLVRRIRSYRDEQVKAGLAKRERPFTPFIEANLPFQLPAGWEWIRFDELIEPAKPISYGVLVPGPEISGGVPFVRIADLSLTDPPAKPEKSISMEVDAQYQRTRLEGGEILMGVVGSIGKLGVAPPTWAGANIARAICRIVPVGLVDRGFVLLLLQSEFMRASFAGDTRTLAQPTLNVGLIRSFATPLPPIAEQARIVARVDELMRLCDALEAKGRLEAEQHARLLGTLLGTLTDSSTPEELAANWQRVTNHFDLLLDRPEAVNALEQTILQLAVRGLLVPQDPEDEPANLLLLEIRSDRRRLLGDNAAKADKASPPINEAEVRFALPSGWSWARLSEISNVIVDCPHSTAKFVETGVLCLDTNSFKDGKLLPHKLRFVSQQTFDERIARLKPEPGDLVFAREGSVGQSIIIPEGIECCLGQRVMLFRLSQRVSNEFVRLAITTDDFLDALLSLHKGIGAKHVNVADMRNAVVPVPPFSEQERILARVTELRRLCTDLRERLSASRTAQSHLAEALVAEAA